MELNETYWTGRYLEKSTGWDIGYAAPPIVHFVDKIQNKALKILIPGCGNAYEAEYLWKSGFKNVYLLDISLAPLEAFSEKVPDFPKENLLHQDFFTFEGRFDLILEQTFFCALNPALRSKYVVKMHQLLSEEGCLVGVLFNEPLYEDHPPFGGSKILYESIFQKFFHIQKMELCYNSIAPRQGRELFIKLQPIKSVAHNAAF